MKINDETIRRVFPSIEGYISSLNKNNYPWSWWVWVTSNIREAFDICGLDKSVTYGTLLQCEDIKCIPENDRELHGRLKQLNNLVANVCMLNEIRKFLIQEYIWEDSKSSSHIDALYKAISFYGSIQVYNTFVTIDAVGYYSHFLEDHTIAEKDKVVFRKIKNLDVPAQYSAQHVAEGILIIAEEEKDILIGEW